MTAEKPPIRITKQRAQAFLEAADRGIDEWRDSLKQLFGVRFTRDGEVEQNEDFQLLTAEQREEVDERVDQIQRALDTLAIFRRRYG